MSQITIRNIDPSVENIIRKEAIKRQISLSEVTNQLIMKALGFENNPAKKRDLKSLSGVWSETEAEEFDNTQKNFSTIDEELWK